MVQEIIEGFALSPQQRRLFRWIHLADNAQAFRAGMTISLEGDIEPRALQAALAEVVRRHEILRTAFPRFEGLDAPTQVIQESFSAALPHYDLSALGDLEQEARIERLYGEDGERPSDIEREPPLRATLLSLSSRRHVLVVTLPALCADAYTLKVLVRELANAYSPDGSRARDRDDPVQYADLAEWHNELLESAETETGRAYWRRQDFSALSGSRLPSWRKGGRQPHGAQGCEAEFAPTSSSVEMSAEVCARAAALSESHGVTPAAFYLACWQALLWRLTGEARLLIGVAFDGRAHKSLADALGLLGKVIPIGCELCDEEEVRFAMRRAEERLSEVRKWADYFSWELVAPEQLGPDTGNPHAALRQTFYVPLGFSFDVGVEAVAVGACPLTFKLASVAACIEPFDAALHVAAAPGGASCRLHYNSALYSAEEMETLLERYVNVV